MVNEKEDKQLKRDIKAYKELKEVLRDSSFKKPKLHTEVPCNDFCKDCPIKVCIGKRGAILGAPSLEYICMIEVYLSLIDYYSKEFKK